MGFAPPEDPRGLPVASRTDRGVSAVGNAFVLEAPVPGATLLRALNGIAPEMFFSHAAEVPSGWRVRSADERSYRYFEAGPGVDASAYRRGAEALVGRIDVRSFGRRLPDRAPVWRDVSSVHVSSLGDGVVVEVRAPSFVWGMVRKMVSALRAVNAGTVDAERIRAAVAGGRRLDLPLAEPEPLVLWDVRYPFPWTHATHRYGRQQLRYWSSERRSWSARGSVLDAMRAALPEASGPSNPTVPASRRPRAR